MGIGFYMGNQQDTYGTELFAITRGIHHQASHPVNSGSRVDEDRVPMATLLAPAQDPERLVDGEIFRIEYLFVCPEVKAASCPATR